MKKANHSIAKALMMIVLCAGMGSELSAANFNWDDGSGADSNWNTAANWNPDGVPANATTTRLFFGVVGSGSTNNDIVAFNLNRLTFQAGLTSPFAVTGNAFTMDRFSGGGGAQPQIRMNTNSNVSIANNIVLDNNGSNTTLTMQGTGTGILTYNGAISFGAGASNTTLTKINDFTLVLGATSDVDLTGGAINIRGGTLESQNENALKGGSIDIRFRDDSATSTETLLITTNDQDYDQELRAENGDTGTIEVDGGITFTLENAGSANALRWNDSASSFEKTGDGTFVIDKQSFTSVARGSGDMTVSNGIMRIADNDSLGNATGSTTVGSGGTLDLTGGITVTGEALTISGTGEGSVGALRNFSGSNTWTGAIDLDANATIASDAGDLTISGTIDNDTFNLSLDGAGDMTISGIISDTGGLIKDGNGTATLTGVNTYSGTTTVNDGVLEIEDASALGTTGTGTTVTSGGTLALDTGIIVGAEALTLNGTGEGGTEGALRNTAGSNEWQGAVDLGSAATINSTAGSLDISGNIDNQTFDLTVNGAGDTTFSGVLSDTGDLVKAGTGTLTLSGTNTYTGVTTIQAGTIDVQNTDALGGTGSGTVVQSGGTLEVSAIAANMAAEPLTINGTGVGGVNGALHWTDAGTDQWTGNITLGSDSLIVIDAGNMRFSGDIDLNGNNLTMDNDVTARMNGGAIFTGTGDLIKEGIGTFRIEGGGVNDYVGDTTVNTGRLRLAGAAGTTKITGDLFIGDGVGATGADRVILGSANHIADTSAVTINSTGRLDLNNNNETIGSLTGATATAQVFLGSGTLTVGDATSTTFAGIISETGALVKEGTGTLTLSGVNTFTGTTTINDGSLSISADSGLGTAPGAPTPGHLIFDGGTLNNSATFTLDSNRGIDLQAGGGTFDTDFGTTLTYGGVMAGTGDLTKDGTGTLTLSGVNTYSGSTTINDGTLSISADSNLGAAPGTATPGHLTFDGGTLNTTATFTLDSNRGIALNAGGGTIETDAATTLTYGGIMAGSGTFDKTGTGTLILDGVNTYTGLTTVQAGTLEVTDANALGGTGSGTVVQSGATLEVSSISADMAAEPLTINGTGAGGVGSLFWTNSGLEEWTGAITLGSNSTIANSSGSTMRLPGDIDLNGSTLTVDTAALAGIINGASISGTGNFIKEGSSTWFMGAGTGGSSTYTGSTTVNAGILNMNVSGGTSVPGDLIINNSAIAFVGSSEQITDTSAVTINSSGRLDVNSFTETIGSLTSASATSEVFLGDGTLTVGDATSTTFAGVISETGDIVKAGTGTLTLTGTNTFTGDTTIDAGILELNNGSGNALDGTANIVINSGSLLLSGDNQIVNTANMDLDGGIFDTDGNDDVLGTLTLSSDSSIDVGTGASILEFADSSGLEIAWTTSGQILSILDYTGDTNGGGIDQIIFAAQGLTNSQLAAIRFVNPWGSGLTIGARWEGNEIVPVPEPSTYLGAGLILTLIGWRERRRLLKLIRRSQSRN